MLIKLAA